MTSDGIYIKLTQMTDVKMKFLFLRISFRTFYVECSYNGQIQTFFIVVDILKKDFIFFTLHFSCRTGYDLVLDCCFHWNFFQTEMMLSTTFDLKLEKHS